LSYIGVARSLSDRNDADLTQRHALRPRNDGMTGYMMRSSL
jgi:hypothetical protein